MARDKKSGTVGILNDTVKSTIGKDLTDKEIDVATSIAGTVTSVVTGGVNPKTAMKCYDKAEEFYHTLDKATRKIPNKIDEVMNKGDALIDDSNKSLDDFAK